MALPTIFYGKKNYAKRKRNIRNKEGETPKEVNRFTEPWVIAIMLLLVAAFIEGVHVTKHDYYDNVRSSACADA